MRVAVYISDGDTQPVLRERISSACRQSHTVHMRMHVSVNVKLGYIDCRTAYGCPAGLCRAASVVGQRCLLTYKEHCAGPQVVGQHVVKETYQCAQTETLDLIQDRLISAYKPINISLRGR